MEIKFPAKTKVDSYAFLVNKLSHFRQNLRQYIKTEHGLFLRSSPTFCRYQSTLSTRNSWYLCISKVQKIKTVSQNAHKTQTPHYAPRLNTENLIWL